MDHSEDLEGDRIWRALESLPSEPLSAEAAARIVPQLRAATLARQARLRRQRMVRAAAAGGLLMAAAAAVILIWSPRRPPVAPVAVTSPSTAPAPAPSSSSFPSAPEPTLVVDVNGTDGSRSRAIALASSTLDRGDVDPPQAIVDALVRTLRSDRNPGVRLRAAEALGRLFPTPQIRAAFIRALEHDANPAVRIVAVEALGRAAHDLDHESIEALRQRARDESENTHVRTRVARALQTIQL